ncbi:MAG: IS110 family RNA-guided transposase [Vulcanimicrobiaceae bacterium]
MSAILGIDIGKSEFHAALLVDDRMWSKSFPNVKAGLKQLVSWLKNHNVEQVHACLQSTGGFEEALALDLNERGHVVSVVNPSRIKAFAQSELLRTKTDAVDAALIARFCRAHVPEDWIPPTPEIRALQALVRRYASIQDMLSMDANRLGSARIDNAVERSLREHIAYLEAELQRVSAEIKDLIDRHPPLREQRDLITSIPGIGDLTASHILGEIPNVSQYRTSGAVAAFAGLSPREHQSGISRGRTRLAKTGNARLRKALYFPAMSAIRYNPILQALYQRLLAAGKPKMVALAAVMRKLLILAYGVLKIGRPFDSIYAGS